MTYLEFGEKKTEMDETENTVAEILDDLINSALDKIFQGRNLPIFRSKIIIFNRNGGSGLKWTVQGVKLDGPND